MSIRLNNSFSYSEPNYITYPLCTKQHPGICFQCPENVSAFLLIYHRSSFLSILFCTHYTTLTSVGLPCPGACQASTEVLERAFILHDSKYLWSSLLAFVQEFSYGDDVQLYVNRSINNWDQRALGSLLFFSMSLDMVQKWGGYTGQNWIFPPSPKATKNYVQSPSYYSFHKWAFPKKKG